MQLRPATVCFPITPSDTIELNSVSELYIGVGGTVVVDDAAGNLGVVFQNVPDASVLPLSVRKVRAATTATGIVALRG